MVSTKQFEIKYPSYTPFLAGPASDIPHCPDGTDDCDDDDS